MAKLLISATYYYCYVVAKGLHQIQTQLNTEEEGLDTENTATSKEYGQRTSYASD